MKARPLTLFRSSTVEVFWNLRDSTHTELKFQRSYAFGGLLLAAEEPVLK